MNSAKKEKVTEVLRSFRDGLIRHLDQLAAASAHLDRDLAKSGSPELQARSLVVIGAAQAAHFAPGVVLEVRYGVFCASHEIILA
jgi:hypothetical protein